MLRFQVAQCREMLPFKNSWGGAEAKGAEAPSNGAFAISIKCRGLVVPKKNSWGCGRESK